VKGTFSPLTVRFKIPVKQILKLWVVDRLACFGEER
jgi:hypothetical protein